LSRHDRLSGLQRRRDQRPGPARRRRAAPRSRRRRRAGSQPPRRGRSAHGACRDRRRPGRHVGDGDEFQHRPPAGPICRLGCGESHGPLRRRRCPTEDRDTDGSFLGGHRLVVWGQRGRDGAAADGDGRNSSFANGNRAAPGWVRPAGIGPGELPVRAPGASRVLLNVAVRLRRGRRGQWASGD